MAKRKELSKKEKAAILLVSLGAEKSSKVMKLLNEDEMDSLVITISGLNKIDAQTKEAVIKEFYDDCLAQKYVAEGGIDYAKKLLVDSLGSARAAEILSRIAGSLQVRPFEFLNRIGAENIAVLLAEENPQVIALILAHIQPTVAASVLAILPNDKKAPTAAKIAMLKSCSPEYVQDIERVLLKKLSHSSFGESTQVGGIASIVNILNVLDRGTEKRILETLEVVNPDLTDEIRRKMFVFEDIVKLSDKSIQLVLRKVDNSLLPLALKSASEDVSKAILRNLSQRSRDVIKDDMEVMGPVRVADVDTAQQQIVNVIREMVEKDEIVISRGTAEEFI